MLPCHLSLEVRKLGPEVFRVCDALVDDVVVVSNADIAQVRAFDRQ